MNSNSYIVILFIVNGVSSESVCPVFSNPNNQRDAMCAEGSDCSQDYECDSPREKCCENPCGVTQCLPVDTRLKTIEDCQPDNSGVDTSKCSKVKTQFCYKDNIQRWCEFEKKCNPAPQLIMDVKGCHKEICSAHNCTQQGSTCFVDDVMHTPGCRCVERCNNARKYVCAKHEGKEMTYLNECTLNRLACRKQTRIPVIHKGPCKVVKKKQIPIKAPIIRNNFMEVKIGDDVNVNCYGDRKYVVLNWAQVREGNKEITMSNQFIRKFESYVIDGRQRRILGLYINQLNPSMYGKYACVQTFNNTNIRTYLSIVPPKDYAFDRRDCGKQFDRGSPACKGEFMNYFYDMIPNECKLFNYTGCQGNTNNFQSKHDCEVKCKGIPTATRMGEVHKGVKCGKEMCDYYSVCAKNHTQCECENKCTLAKNHVCASDGSTYLNLCVMRQHACTQRRPLVVLYKGQCVKPKTTAPKTTPSTNTTGIKAGDSSSTRALTLCDLITCPPYARCHVNVFTRAPHCYCHDRCSFRPDFHCGTDGHTHLNGCLRELASCRRNKRIDFRHNGICEHAELKKNTT